jgi:transcriptional regulator with XRE-family HTH domain
MTSMTMTTTRPRVTLGWRLQISLAHGDVSVQQMAEELGVSRSTVSRWLNEHGAPPRVAFLKQWALRTGVAYDWLCPEQDSNLQPTDWWPARRLALVKDAGAACRHENSHVARRRDTTPLMASSMRVPA